MGDSERESGEVSKLRWQKKSGSWERGKWPGRWPAGFVRAGLVAPHEVLAADPSPAALDGFAQAVPGCERCALECRSCPRGRLAGAGRQAAAGGRGPGRDRRRRVERAAPGGVDRGRRAIGDAGGRLAGRRAFGRGSCPTRPASSARAPAAMLWGRRPRAADGADGPAIARSGRSGLSGRGETARRGDRAGRVGPGFRLS